MSLNTKILVIKSPNIISRTQTNHMKTKRCFELNQKAPVDGAFI